MPAATMEAIGICHWCKLPVPATNVDGSPARAGIEYKTVMGDPKTLWHYLHPLYPDCFHAESDDPNSPWYDDPRRHLDYDDHGNMLPYNEEED